MDAPHTPPLVLVMDDDEDVRFIAGFLLQRLGFAVVLAETGREAVERYREHRAAGRPVHAVILDITIPGSMGGKEVLDHLRQLDPGVRAYISSGNPYDPVMADPAAFGFSGALPKPYTYDALRALLTPVQGAAPPGLPHDA